MYSNLQTQGSHKHTVSKNGAIETAQNRFHDSACDRGVDFGLKQSSQHQCVRSIPIRILTSLNTHLRSFDVQDCIESEELVRARVPRSWHSTIARSRSNSPCFRICYAYLSLIRV